MIECMGLACGYELSGIYSEQILFVRLVRLKPTAGHEHFTKCRSSYLKRYYRYNTFFKIFFFIK